jgi:hypothetical protein
MYSFEAIEKKYSITSILSIGNIKLIKMIY